MMAVLQQARPGMTVVQICELGDAAITQGANNTYKKLKEKEKGIAFPTCISVNNCVGHYSPLPDEGDVTLQEGDLVKMCASLSPLFPFDCDEGDDGRQRPQGGSSRASRLPPRPRPPLLLLLPFSLPIAALMDYFIYFIAANASLETSAHISMVTSRRVPTRSCSRPPSPLARPRVTPRWLIFFWEPLDLILVRPNG